uniref:flagellar protein FliT n=1 Tax=Acetatifactor sp. TaxID=1872090 RepID=UPI0040570EBF
MGNYLKVLEESLRKKLQVLDEIQAYNEKQRQAFEGEEVKLDQFDLAIEEKGKLIDRVNKLDDGFVTLYVNVAEELKGHKERYAEQIRVLQELVKQVTDKSISVQAQEARNKALIEEYFARERTEVRQKRISSKAAYDYYKKVKSSDYVPPQFYDSKQ